MPGLGNCSPTIKFFIPYLFWRNVTKLHKITQDHPNITIIDFPPTPSCPSLSEKVPRVFSRSIFGFPYQMRLGRSCRTVAVLQIRGKKLWFVGRNGEIRCEVSFTRNVKNHTSMSWKINISPTFVLARNSLLL